MNIEDLRPADTPEYMTPMWIGCIHWAISTPDVVEAFRRETGNRWEPGRTTFERMIDEATGVDRDFLKAFIRWVNVEIWGPMDGGEDNHAAKLRGSRPGRTE